MSEQCRGCQRVVIFAPGEVDRLVGDFFRDEPNLAVADDAIYESRLQHCDQCEDLYYGTTCKYCGCLVRVRAKLATKSCPAPQPKW